MGKDGLKILVVDDSPAMRKELVKILAELGHHVVGEAGDGYEAVKMYRELKPQLVMLDIVLPRLDGIAALRLLRSVDPEARVVMVTAMTSRKKVLECVKFGAEHYVVKPFEKEKVGEVLAQLFPAGD